ncbi:hypothetical protein SKAU_G00078520 [Synaphobranchus kaupii]|uniref:Uncharacterized protein n=1 Tax=Synaphobranchus kaupii TaxID=118154 RepID=A0A9Q1FU22_SYNKA|nr:hypothetical protein SKAU_G00078520 [Synaphobranchus kaupii]
MGFELKPADGDKLSRSESCRSLVQPPGGTVLPRTGQHAHVPQGFLSTVMRMTHRSNISLEQYEERSMLGCKTVKIIQRETALVLSGTEVVVWSDALGHGPATPVIRQVRAPDSSSLATSLEEE